MPESARLTLRAPPLTQRLAFVPYIYIYIYILDMESESARRVDHDHIVAIKLSSQTLRDPPRCESTLPAFRNHRVTKQEGRDLRASRDPRMGEPAGELIAMTILRSISQSFWPPRVAPLMASCPKVTIESCIHFAEWLFVLSEIVCCSLFSFSTCCTSLFGLHGAPSQGTLRDCQRLSGSERKTGFQESSPTVQSSIV